MTPASLRLLLVGLVVFLMTLPAYLPAGRVLPYLVAAVPAGVVWQQVSGTVFKPRFYQAGFQLASGHRLIFNRIDARISVLPLLLGRLSLQFELESGGGTVTGVATVMRDRWQITHINGELPVATVLSMFPAAGLDGSTGLAIVSGSQLSGNYAGILDAGELVVLFEQLHPAIPGLTRPLGDYELKLKVGRQTVVEGGIKTLRADSPLTIEAYVIVDPAGRLLQIEGQAHASATADDTVRSLLPFFGVVQNDTARIQWRSMF